MSTLTSAYAQWKSGLVTPLIAVAGVVGLTLNIFYIYAVIRSRFLKTAPNLFLLNLAVADILGALAWTIPAVVASATWNWHLGSGMCDFHGFIGMLCFTLNMNTFALIAIEKFFKLVIPSKHRYAFQNYIIVGIVIAALWVYCVVESFMPFIGWSQFNFYNYQVQCTANYWLSESLLNFYVVVTYITPTLVSGILYCILFLKIKALNEKNTTKDGKFVLQEKKDAPGYSYGERMKMQQKKLKDTKFQSQEKKNKKNKKKNAKDKGDDSEKFFHSDDSNVEVSEEEYFHDYQDYQTMKKEKKIMTKNKKVFTYKKHYFFMALTMAITTLIYVALWAPFHIINYMSVYDPTGVKEGSYLFFTAATFFGLSFKPLLYLTNKQVRGSYKRAFQCKKKKKPRFFGGGGEARNESAVMETRRVHEIHHTEEVVETTVTTRNYSEEKMADPPSVQ